jgi:hypothetical protein
VKIRQEAAMVFVEKKKQTVKEHLLAITDGHTQVDKPTLDSRRKNIKATRQQSAQGIRPAVERIITRESRKSNRAVLPTNLYIEDVSEKNLALQNAARHDAQTYIASNLPQLMAPKHIQDED